MTTRAPATAAACSPAGRGRGARSTPLFYQDGGGDPTEIGLGMAGAPGAPYRVRSAGGDGGAPLTLAGTIGLGRGWSIGANLGGAIGANERVAGSAVIGWRF